MSKITTPKEYAKIGGVFCPVCESKSVQSYSNVQIDEGIAWQDCECGECEATWTDQYDLVGYDNLEEKKA